MWKVVRPGTVIAAGLLTALALTGCGGGDSDGAGDDGGKNVPGNGQDTGKTGRTPGGSGDDTGDGPENGSGTGSGTGSADASGSGSGSGSGGGGPTDGAAALEGAWAGKADGKALVLSVASGKAVLITEQGACTGEVRDTGTVTLALKCADGSTERTDGTVESVNGRTLVVSWSGGAKETRDTLAKTAPGTLPSGLPGLPGN